MTLQFTNKDDFLEQYESFCIFMSQGGIHFRFIYDIRKDEPIYIGTSALTSADYEAQSQAAYNIICSKEVFTEEYPWARNCVNAMSSYRNGFQAIYRIASEVIPALNNSPIPNNPPEYNACKDIYDYEKLSRNYWVLKYIRKKEDTAEIEKSEAFINGLAGSKYHEAAKDIRADLNAHRRKKDEILPADLYLNNITLSLQVLLRNDPFVGPDGAKVFNVHAESESDNDRGYSSDSDVNGEIYYTQNNRTQRDRNGPSRDKYRRPDYNNRQRSQSERPQYMKDNKQSRDTRKPRDPYKPREPYKKWDTRKDDHNKNTTHQLNQRSTQQCEVCGTFGHQKYYECWSLAKHILMNRWEKLNTSKADEVATKHLAKNHPDNRSRMARKMVRANVVDANNECAYMFSEDIEDELELRAWSTTPHHD